MVEIGPVGVVDDAEADIVLKLELRIGRDDTNDIWC